MPRRRFVEHLPVDTGAEEVAIGVVLGSSAAGVDVGWETLVDVAERVEDAWEEDAGGGAGEEGSGSSEPVSEPEPLSEPAKRAGPGILKLLKLLSQMSGHVAVLYTLVMSTNSEPDGTLLPPPVTLT